MAELIVKLMSGAHPTDPAKDARLPKRGDLCVVKPDGWGWGRLEVPPSFAVIKIPGVSVDAIKKYTLQWTKPEQAEIWIPKSEYEAGIIPSHLTVVEVLGEVTKTYHDGDVLMNRCLVLVSKKHRRCAWKCDIDGLDIALKDKLEAASITVGRRSVPRDGEPADDCDWDTVAKVTVDKRTGVSEFDAGLTDAVLRTL